MLTAVGMGHVKSGQELQWAFVEFVCPPLPMDSTILVVL